MCLLRLVRLVQQHGRLIRTKVEFTTCSHSLTDVADSCRRHQKSVGNIFDRHKKVLLTLSSTSGQILGLCRVLEYSVKYSSLSKLEPKIMAGKAQLML